MGRQRDPVEIVLQADNFSLQPIPGLDAKIGTAYVSVPEIVKRLDLDRWLGVNPRVPARNGADVLTGPVIAGIQRTLHASPKEFALKNQGLYILVDSIKATDGKIKIRLTDPDIHGLCNGGHTYAAIFDYAASQPEFNGLSEAYVRLHLFEGIGADYVSVMAEGLNRSKQVDDPSLQHLRGLYDSIELVMRDKKGADQIGYTQGQGGAYYITEVIRAIELFNRERFDDERQPNNLYRQQRKMVNLFENDYTANPSPMALIIPHTHEILTLMDDIALMTAWAANSLKFDPTKLGKGGKKKLKKTVLHFRGGSMDWKVPTGWLVVMLAAFRANVEWDLAAGKFGWILKPKELMPKVIKDLVRICVQEFCENKVKPDEMARNPATYSAAYDKVALAIERMKKS